MEEITLHVENNGRWRSDSVVGYSLTKAIEDLAPRLIDFYAGKLLQLRRGPQIIAEFDPEIGGWVKMEDD